MPKKTKEDFKAAFKAIKKPKRPPGVSGKEKSALEKAIDETTDWDDPNVIRLAKDLYANNPDYMVDLVAYKFVKHFDEGSVKKPFWAQKVPEEAFEKALKKVVPGDMSERLTQVTLERAVRGQGDQSNTVALIYERDPEGTINFALDKRAAAIHDGDVDQQKVWVEVIPTGTQEQVARTFEVIAARNDRDAARVFGEGISMLTKTADTSEDDAPRDNKAALNAELDHDTIYSIAEANPRLFVEDVLPSLKSKNHFIEALGNAKLRKLLERSAPEEWKMLVAETPMLSLLENVEQAIQRKKLNKPSAIVAEMFDAIVNNRGIPLAYATNTIDNNRPILTGGTDKEHEFRANQKQVAGTDFPDVPATQCHQLLHLTEDMTNMCPGLTKKPKITQGTVDNILLTKPLASVPGKGLLDKSFGGNVFDDAGKSLDQVLFTGDSGMNSHTWLVIDGTPYDPVLGTRGPEVAASIDETLDWLIVDRVAKGNKGRYIIKGDPGTPKPKANKMGFGSAYRLTSKPEKYLTKDELKQIGLKATTSVKGGT